MHRRRSEVAARVAGSRLTHRWLLVGFATWRRNIANKCAGLVAVKSAVGVLRNTMRAREFQKQNKHFKIWVRAIELTKSALDLKHVRLRNCAAKLASNANRLMSCALHTWYSNATHRHFHLNSEVSSKNEQEKNLRRILNRVTVKGPLQEAMNHWRQRVIEWRTQSLVDEALEVRSDQLGLERKQHILLLSLSLKHDSRNLFKLGRAWRLLRKVVECHKRGSKDKVRSSNLFGSVFKRWSARKLAAAFHSWVRHSLPLICVV